MRLGAGSWTPSGQARSSSRYTPAVSRDATYFGTIGLFLTLFFLFIRFVPMIAMFEVRTLLPQAKVKSEHGH